MNFWTIPESLTTPLPTFDVSWLPPAAYRYVTPRVSGGLGGSPIVRLEAGPYVGTLPLQNGDVLYIAPRCGREAFGRMLFLTEGIDKAVDEEFNRLSHIGFSGDDGVPWYRTLLRPFSDQLRRIEKLSLQTERETLHVRRGCAVGRLRVLPTLLSVAKSEPRPVHSIVRQKTLLTLENRTLATAALALLQHGGPDVRADAALRRWAERSRGKWITPEELRQVSQGLQGRRYTGSRSYYVPALVAARLILSQVSPSLTTEDLTETEPLLTNMALMFEDYMRRILTQGLAPRGYIVEKGVASLASAMFTDGACTINPDIVVSTSRIVLVGDAKYKPNAGPDASDYYQVFSYLQRSGADSAFLVMPGRGNSPEVLRRTLFSGKFVHEITFPIDAWANSERELVSIVEAIAGGIGRS